MRLLILIFSVEIKPINLFEGQYVVKHVEWDITAGTTKDLMWHLKHLRKQRYLWTGGENQYNYWIGAGSWIFLFYVKICNLILISKFLSVKVFIPKMKTKTNFHNLKRIPIFDWTFHLLSIEINILKKNTIKNIFNKTLIRVNSNFELA